MAKGKKSDDNATLQVSVEDFRRTRDSVVTGLATLQNAVVELSRAYIAHTNTVLGRPPNAGPDLLTLSNSLGDASLLQPNAPLAAGAQPTSPEEQADAPADGKKEKKKKRYHDPNAPKRPLTPYFLYMQSARSLIADDLGPNVKPGEVSAEGTQRWVAMPEPEKERWKLLYARNLEIYQGKMAAYKAGKDWQTMDDQAAAQLAKEGGATIEPFEEDPPAPVPPKAPTPPKEPKPSKRRKVSKAAAAAVPAEEPAAKPSAPKEAPAPVAPMVNMTKTPVPVPGIPDSEKEKAADTPSSKKKKKATPKKTKGAAAAAPAPAPAAEQPAPAPEKKSRKKRKSEAVEA